MSESASNGDNAVEERRKALAKLKRPELDAEATGVGVEKPDEIGNAEEVIEAILAKEADQAATEAAAAEAAERETNPHYTREELVENARAITGYRSHFVVGALSGTEQKKFTKAEATKLVKDFMGKPDNTREGEK